MIAASRQPKEPFVVCDPFLGSGSCAVACVRQGTDFVGGDLSETAVELAQARVASVQELKGDPCQKKSAVVPELMERFW